MYMFFDTETTGIPNDHEAPASDTNNWPRLVQIAWVLTDESGNELRSQSFIVRPKGFDIPASATRVHGISTEIAVRLGIDVERALTAFFEDLSVARVLVAHNVHFDERVIGAEFYRAGYKQEPLSAKTLLCTMRSSTSFCKLPGGPRGYKWPTLIQLHNKLFGASFDSAHNAIVDVRACAKCFFELKRQGIITGHESLSDDDDDGDFQSYDDQDLFDEIYELAGSSSWFDTSRFVDNVYAQFEDRNFITDKQRDALGKIRDMLASKVG